jgi:hypothetical protein
LLLTLCSYIATTANFIFKTCIACTFVVCSLYMGLFTCIKAFPQLVATLRELSYIGYLWTPFAPNDGGVKMFSAAGSLTSSHFQSAGSSPAARHVESQTLSAKCCVPSAVCSAALLLPLCCHSREAPANGALRYQMSGPMPL